jgi:hypothetical protein
LGVTCQSWPTSLLSIPLCLSWMRCVVASSVISLVDKHGDVSSVHRLLAHRFIVSSAVHRFIGGSSFHWLRNMVTQVVVGVIMSEPIIRRFTRRSHSKQPKGRRIVITILRVPVWYWGSSNRDSEDRCQCDTC